MPPLFQHIFPLLLFFCHYHAYLGAIYCEYQITFPVAVSGGRGEEEKGVRRKRKIQWGAGVGEGGRMLWPNDGRPCESPHQKRSW